MCTVSCCMRQEAAYAKFSSLCDGLACHWRARMLFWKAEVTCVQKCRWEVLQGHQMADMRNLLSWPQWRLGHDALQRETEELAKEIARWCELVCMQSLCQYCAVLIGTAIAA